MRSKRDIRLVLTIFMAVAVALFLSQLCIAGSLEPGAQPGPTMHTLDEIYKKIDNVTQFPQCDGMRFLDLFNGTIADCRTGLIWMKLANCGAEMTWDDAKSFCTQYVGSYGSCGLLDDSVPGDWHLPTIRELESLIDNNYFNPALSNAAGDGKWVEGDPFVDVMSHAYWSSSTYLADPSGYAWAVGMGGGGVVHGPKTSTIYVWCVR